MKQFELNEVRVYCDFNDKTEFGGYWILRTDGRPLEDVLDYYGIKNESKVVLFQDGGDFEVSDNVYFGCLSKYYDGEKICAVPIWNTIKRFK